MNLSAKKILKIGSISVFFLLIFIFAFLRSSDLIFGVKIRNVDINGLPAQSGAKFTDNILKITGNAKNATHLILNGREISINQVGDFSETVALLSGYNIISIQAKDKFGDIDEKNYKLMFTPS
ncbi:MAG: hypothetical protein KGL67_00100 [Patescibacteria group bacterium]|nr:hypothetical protein [Patescibacteria group bacterium]